MPYDAGHVLEHAEVAGWALGALDPDDAKTFEEHLRTCDDCQAAAAEFEPVVTGLKRAAPAVEPPDDLQAKTIAAVQYAVLAGRLAAAPAEKPAAVATEKPTTIMARPAAVTASPPQAPAAKASRWWHLHWTNPLLPLATALAAAAVTAAAFIGVQALPFNTPATAATISLKANSGLSGLGHATAQHTSGGWKIQLTVKHLPALHTGQFYECWYAGPENRSGNPQLISAGTFVVDRNGNGTFTMWSAADPTVYKIMQITVERSGDASQQGQVILSGVART